MLHYVFSCSWLCFVGMMEGMQIGFRCIGNHPAPNSIPPMPLVTSRFTSRSTLISLSAKGKLHCRCEVQAPKRNVSQQPRRYKSQSCWSWFHRLGGYQIVMPGSSAETKPTCPHSVRLLAVENVTSDCIILFVPEFQREQSSCAVLK